MNKFTLSKYASMMEKISLTDDERAKHSGSFVKLKSGNTHFQVGGEGENVVLVHGYATPYYIYDKIYDGLIKAGYRVLRYDLMGRGLSERIKADYTPSLFVTQLKEITEYVFGAEQFYLFGTSMGGTIVEAFTAKYPEKVKKLVLLAPAGMDSFVPPLFMKISALPVLGEILFATIGKQLLLKKCASELKYVDKKEKDYYYFKFFESNKYKGFWRCTLSSLRNTILNLSESVKGYYQVANIGTPTMCIWGTDDKTMPYYQSIKLMEINPNTELVTFEDSGHIFVFDEGQRTLEKVIPFLKK